MGETEEVVGGVGSVEGSYQVVDGGVTISGLGSLGETHTSREGTRMDTTASKGRSNTPVYTRYT